MINVIIVDDEKNALELINSKVSDMNQFKVLGAFMNPMEAYKAIVSQKPDLVITDIEMPVISGIELAEKISLKDKQIQFVFLTAYKQYAIDAFEMNAVHYVLKPVSKKDLEKVYHRMRKILNIQKNWINKRNKILTFGDFSVINSNGKRVRFPTSKVEELFALLIMNKENGVGKWRLINELWDISLIKKPLQNLYTSIYRLRKTFENYDLPYDIKKTNDNYKIEFRYTFFDYEEYNKMFYELKTLDITEKNLVEFKKLVDLYNGDLFMYKDYIWCIYKRSGLNSNYHFVLKKLQEFYQLKEMQQEIIEINSLIKKSFDSI